MHDYVMSDCQDRSFPHIDKRRLCLRLRLLILSCIKVIIVACRKALCRLIHIIASLIQAFVLLGNSSHIQTSV